MKNLKNLTDVHVLKSSEQKEILGGSYPVAHKCFLGGGDGEGGCPPGQQCVDTPNGNRCQKSPTLPL